MERRREQQQTDKSRISVAIGSWLSDRLGTLVILYVIQGYFGNHAGFFCFSFFSFFFFLEDFKIKFELTP